MSSPPVVWASAQLTGTSPALRVATVSPNVPQASSSKNLVPSSSSIPTSIIASSISSSPPSSSASSPSSSSSASSSSSSPTNHEISGVLPSLSTPAALQATEPRKAGLIEAREAAFEEQIRERLRAVGHINPGDIANPLCYTFAEKKTQSSSSSSDQLDGDRDKDFPKYKQIGALLVTVIGATGIKEKSPSPFVKLKFDQQYARTTVQKDTATPLWKQTFVFRVDNPNAQLCFVLKSENSVLKDSKLGRVFIPLSDVHPKQSSGRDLLVDSFPVVRHKKKTSASLGVKIVYIYEPAWDFISLFENKQLVEESRRIPEADPEPDISYLQAFRILRGNIYRFLVAIVPFLELFLYVRDLVEWKNPALTLLFLVLMTYTLLNQYFFTSLLWCVAFFLGVNLMRRAREVFRSQTKPIRLTDQVSDSDQLLEGMRAEVAPVLTRVRRGKPPDTILQDMITLASIFAAIADASIFFRKLSAVSPLAHDNYHLQWITAEHWKKEVTLILSFFVGGLCCAFLPVVPICLFLLRFGLIAGLWYRLTWGFLAETYPRIVANFSPVWVWRQLVKALLPLVVRAQQTVRLRFPVLAARLPSIFPPLPTQQPSSSEPIDLSRTTTATTTTTTTRFDGPQTRSQLEHRSLRYDSKPLVVDAELVLSSPIRRQHQRSRSMDNLDNLQPEASPTTSTLSSEPDLTSEVPPGTPTLFEAGRQDSDRQLTTSTSSPRRILVIGHPSVKTIKASLLQKRSSGLLKSWTPRLLVILKEIGSESYFLQYYRTAEVKGQIVRETSPLAQYNLRDILLIDLPGEKSGRPFAFLLTGPKELNLYFACSDAASKETWLRTLVNAMTAASKARSLVN